MKRGIVAGALVVAGALFVGGAFLVGSTGQGWAADLPEPPPPPPPRAPAAYMPFVAPVYNWGGLYYGINGGYGFGSSQWSFPVGTTSDFNITGWTGGATIGANIQADAFVFGVDADFDAMAIKGSTICSPVSCQTQDSWLTTVRARVGYAMDRVLIYGTAGGAFGNIQANTNGTKFQSTNKAGWVAGGGVETAFADHWTARLEYLFVDLQNGSFTTVAPAIAGSDSVKFTTSLIRAGIDYKFR
jgi:outer membrane immunogenic protein